MDKSIIDNWYPKTFAQRVDYILLCIYNLCKHIGQSVELDKPELFSLFFIDRQETDPLTKSNKWREEDSCSAEAGYMLETLTEEGYIKTDAKYNVITSAVKIALTSKGYSRVDSLQKNMTKGNNTLVAMKFGDETIPLREAIRKGIHAAGYNAIFIDEVQHNDFITPELLKYIRDSRFAVVDLTHKNNGAYFEEGYAMGLGKPVIQLCKKGTDLHFDIAQKNTIMWEKEADIPMRLENRIRATID